MFGSWLLGFVGTLLGVIGGIGTVIGFLACVGQGTWAVMVIGFVLLALGSFLKYLSKQTVQVKA